ncbi:MAG: IS30 family transposase [Treponema sp.]|nr:IS30 family transposase [Clostridia bacterium]MBP3606733.1 IS30 family transposase [Treponema sp.]
MKNKYFTEKERYQLEAYRKAKVPVKEIARLLDKCERTIYYELKRGTVEVLDTHLRKRKEYSAYFAQNKYEKIRENKGAYFKAQNDIEFIAYVQDLIINKKYSAYAVSVALSRSDLKTKVCERTIYNYIKKGFFPNVTSTHMPYKPRKKKEEKVKRISWKNSTKPMIHERDKEIYKRLTYGHWEMDTVYSGQTTRNKDCLLVLTERKCRQEIVIHMPDRKASSVVYSLDSLEKMYGKQNFRKIFKTITCDNGLEFSDYEGIIKGGRTKLYYCHPYCSSERGSNENANKLIRRWIPKGADISKYVDQIEDIQEWINNYPRKLFGGLSCNEYMQLIQEFE